MRQSKAFILMIAALLTHYLAAPRPAQGGTASVPLVSFAVTEPFPGPEDNFETVLTGNQTSLFTGQFLTAFAQPNSVSDSFDTTSNTTTVNFSGQGQPISNDAPTPHTFGFAISAANFVGGVLIVNPPVVDGYWTMGQTIDGHVPAPTLSAQYTPASHLALITITNDPFPNLVLSNVGYKVTNTQIDLASLNPTSNPASSFLPASVPDGTVLMPGQSTSFDLHVALSGQFVTIFAEADFTGDSPHNPADTGVYFEFQAVPEPASWVLLLIGAATLLIAAPKECRLSLGERTFLRRAKDGIPRSAPGYAFSRARLRGRRS